MPSSILRGLILPNSSFISDMSCLPFWLHVRSNSPVTHESNPRETERWRYANKENEMSLHLEIFDILEYALMFMRPWTNVRLGLSIAEFNVLRILWWNSIEAYQNYNDEHVSWTIETLDVFVRRRFYLQCCCETVRSNKWDAKIIRRNILRSHSITFKRLGSFWQNLKNAIK